MCVDDLLPKRHSARDVWRYVEGLNLDTALNQIQSYEGDAGRSAADQKILLALWLYATLEGIGSACYTIRKKRAKASRRRRFREDQSINDRS